jgi:endo-1,4-beta-xylanase
LFSLLAASLSAGFTLCAPPPPAWLDPDRSEPAGTRYRTFESRLAGSQVSYLAYLPPDYTSDEARRYPVVYWLHGLGGSQRSGAPFVAQLDGAIRKNRAPAMIAVLVNGMRDSFYCDSPDGKWPVESVIVKELIPHIDQTYRTLARREARAVEGYSMGGFGAARLGFKYPEAFGMVGVMAGALLDADGIPARHGGLFTKMFGSAKDRYLESHPHTLLEKNVGAIRDKSVIRVAVGDRDRLQLRSQALHELLDRLKVEHDYEVVPGVAHNISLFYEKLGDRGFEIYQRQALRVAPQRSPAGRQAEFTSIPSRVITRGDLELLTFETTEEFERLEELYRKTQQTAPAAGAFATLYFRSPTDNSVQPYAVGLPRQYDSSRKYPLAVQLHGLNFKEIPGGQRSGYRGMQPEHWTQPDLPVIYVHCYGRPSTFYAGIGEVDVLATIEEVKRRFPVDAGRVHIMGHSMGGAGSYTVGLHYPDLFGSIMPSDAAMGGRLALPPDLPEWMRPQAALQTVPKLYPNARNLDVFFKNAGAGIQGRTTEHSDGIAAQGGFATSESFPGVPHNMAPSFPYGTFIPELIQHPVKRRPPEVKFWTNTLQYNRAYWVTIDRLTRHNADALLTATCDDGKVAGSASPAVRVSTANIDAMTLRLADAPISRDAAALVIDGRQVLSGPLPAVVRISRTSGEWKAGEYKPSGLVKRHGLQGPIGDAFNSRFLAVYGEGDRELAIAELDAIRNPPGPLIIHGEFPMKAAAKVTSDDIASSNLILFGAPATNPVLRRIAGSLPAGIAAEAGEVFIYPNPENPSRYVVVWGVRILSSPSHGVRAGWVMPLNLLPDYIRVKDGRVVSGGHFDSDWNLNAGSPTEPRRSAARRW